MALRSVACPRVRNLPAPRRYPLFLLLLFISACCGVSAARFDIRRIFKFWQQTDDPDGPHENMGQAMRTMTYDRASNERQARPALKIATTSLKWYRLDDGVMGGQSESQHVAEAGGALHFAGTINTNGGGFTSIRATIPGGIFSKSTDSIRIRYRGDGKTYKFIMSDGQRFTGAPMSKTPSWQVDLPTKAKNWKEDEWDEAVVSMSSLLPAYGGGSRAQPSADERSTLQLDPSEMKQIGLMLSLRLSNGDPNPNTTFGEGIFPFSLRVASIEPLYIEDLAK